MSNKIREALEQLMERYKLDGHLLNYDVSIARAALKEDGWVDVKERPLFKMHDDSLTLITEDGEREFLAAVPYNDKTRPKEKNLWWIHHCVIEESGLCVVGEDSNEPAGWELEDVTHYFPLPQPPTTK